MASNKKVYAHEHERERVVEGFGPATCNCATREEYAEFIKRARAFLDSRIHGDTPEPIVIRANKTYKPHVHVKIFAISTRKHADIVVPDKIGEFEQIAIVTARRPQSITMRGGIVADETARVFGGTHIMRFIDFTGRAIYISENIRGTADVWTGDVARARELIITREPSRRMIEQARERSRASGGIDMDSLRTLIALAHARTKK
jgi:hypothetical protein